MNGIERKEWIYNNRINIVYFVNLTIGISIVSSIYKSPYYMECYWVVSLRPCITVKINGGNQKKEKKRK